MPAGRIVAIDRASRSPLSHGRHTRVAWSSEQAWTSLILERLVHERLDTPEFVIDEPCVVVHVSEAARVEHTIGGVCREVVAQPGNICLFSAGAPRQLRSGERHEVVVLALYPELIERAAAGRGGARTHSIREHLELRDRRILRIARALELEVREGCSSGALYGESLGLALAAYLWKRYAVPRAAVRPYRGGMTPKILRRVTGYIEDNLAEDLRLCALAQVAGLSETRFAHNFKGATGVSPYRYVMSLKIERAKRLLIETQMTVTEIAYALGFSSPSGFSSVFGQWAGTPPSDYRRRRG